jgi:hypothetical protein
MSRCPTYDLTNAGQLNFRFAALAKARIESISRRICASKAAGVIGIGSIPCCASFSRTLGAASAFCVSWASLSTISRGVLAGANSPVLERVVGILVAGLECGRHVG